MAEKINHENPTFLGFLPNESIRNLMDLRKSLNLPYPLVSTVSAHTCH